MEKMSTLCNIWKKLSIRKRQLICLIFINEYGIGIGNIASGLQVSTKTVRNELAELEVLLRNTTLSFEKKPGIGILISAMTVEDEEFMRRKCSQLNILTLDDRKIYIAQKLLLPSPMGLTELELEKQLYVSRSSIRNELHLLDVWFARFKLRICKRKNYGIYIEGTEWNIRKALIELLQNEYALSEERLTATDYCVRINSVHKKILSKFYQGFDGERIERFIIFLEKAEDIFLQKEFYVILWLSLCTGIYRLKTGHQLNLAEKQFPECYKKEKFVALDYLISTFDKQSNLILPPSEKAYFVMFMDSFGIWNSDDEKKFGTKPENFDKFQNEILGNIEYIFGINLAKEDDLVNSFINHLRSSLLRMRYGIYVTNSLLLEIKKNYPSIWTATWANSVLFEKYYGLQITEDEIAFLTTYIGAIIKKSKDIIKACVVCDYGVGASRLLSESIQEAVPQIEVTDIISFQKYHQIRLQKEKDWQLVISTRTLKEDKIPVVVVPGMLSERDLLNIKHYVEMRKWREKKSNEIGIPVKDENDMLLKYSLIYLNYKPCKKLELLKFACTQLEKEGCVTENFFSSLLNRENRMSTEVGNGIAIPHGSPIYVRKSAILVIRLSEPIIWVKSHLVDIIFVLALKLEKNSIDSIKAKRFFKNLAILLDDYQSQSNIRRASTAEEFINYMDLLKQ